jgi:F0F1-type ATP synthase membrane subunit b/b'
MDADKAYINKMEGAINERQAEIGELKANIQQVKAEAQLQYDDEIKQTGESAGDAWSDIKNGVIDAWGEISNAAGKAASRFKRD